jgi:membrane-bound inhibitor of C-type lysozyme
MKILRQAVVFIVAAVMLSCAQTRAVTYHCEKGMNFVVIFDDRGEKAVVRMNEGEISLPLVRSASGAKYSDGRTTFWGKGKEAFIEIDGRIVYSNCKTGTDR